jgi:hypothetical protein
MVEAPLLDAAAAYALKYLQTLDTRPIGVTATWDELRARLTRPFPEKGEDAERVIRELISDTEAGILGSTSGRFFGWVIGGTLPVALAAD